MAYEVVMPYHLHMPSYFLETFTEYPFVGATFGRPNIQMDEIIKKSSVHFSIVGKKLFQSDICQWMGQ